MRVPATLAWAFILLMPAAASAQQSSSRLWITAGAAGAAQRGDCPECEGDCPYRNATSMTGTGG
jgi:hypothetical protein